MFPEDDPSVRDDNTNYSEQQIDSEFAKYLDRDYWERKKHAQVIFHIPFMNVDFYFILFSYRKLLPLHLANFHFPCLQLHITRDSPRMPLEQITITMTGHRMYRPQAHFNNLVPNKIILVQIYRFLDHPKL